MAAADIAIAAEDATFALTEVKLGLAAAIISLTVHHRMNPRAAALTTLGGEVFTGTEAAAYGLVTRAVPGRRARRGGAPGLRAASPPAPPRGCASPSGSSTATCVARIDARGEEMAALSARLFASDEAQGGDDRVPVPEGSARCQRHGLDGQHRLSRRAWTGRQARMDT